MNLDPLVIYLAFCIHVRVLATTHRASVTSWWRTKIHNAAVHGSAVSYHLEGLAVDLVCDDPAQHEPLAEAARNRGLDAVVESDHVHIELDTRKL